MQPTPYTPDFNFTEFQATNPSAPLPGYKVDAEFAHLDETIDDILTNLALIQRDDGLLKNDIVTVDAIDENVLLAIAAAVVAHTKGSPGEDAPLPNFTIEATTLPSGSDATIAVAGIYPDLTLTLGIPRGPSGVGSAGATLADGDYGDVAATGEGETLTVQSVNGQVPSFPGHGHAIADIAGLQVALDGKLNEGEAVDWADVTNIPGTFPPSAHNHAIEDVTGLQTALDGKQAAGAYATTVQLDNKADAITSVVNRSTSQNVSDATHNGTYNRMTGATSRNITFGATPAPGHCSLWVNRGTVNMTVICGGGYYKNGAARATANFTLPPNAELSALHEGGGEWKFTTS